LPSTNSRQKIIIGTLRYSGLRVPSTVVLYKVSSHTVALLVG